MKLAGTAASGGKAKGVVRIVLESDHFHDLKKGEILVTDLKPDNLIVIKLAKAIISEEGGITSHLAKAARELNTPCIVNVKNALKILKTGDLVEVDGDKGEINIKR